MLALSLAGALTMNGPLTQARAQETHDITLVKRTEEMKRREVWFGSRLCENSDAELARRISILIWSLRKPIALVGAACQGQLRKQF